MSENEPHNLLGFDPQSIRTGAEVPQEGTGSEATILEPKPDDSLIPRRSQATEIVEMALKEFQLRVSPDGEAFVVTDRLPHLAIQLRGGKFSMRHLLAAEYFDRFERVPSNTALGDAISVLEGKAQRLEPTQTHLRVAHHEGICFVDLGNAEGQVVRIDDKGWSIEPTSPVVFRRTEVGQAMPMPARGGDLESLWSLCNVGLDERPLVLSWLLATFRPEVPCPILVLVGEQGCAKSTSTRVLVSLVDPSLPLLRRPPSSDVDWPVVAQASRVVALDNMSHIPERLSGALCRAVSGDGDLVRRLYSNGQVVPFAFMRAFLLNGISIGSLGADLAERTLFCTLGVIPADQRKLDAQIKQDLDRYQPLLLGALFDLLSQVLRKLPTVKLPTLPRMCDFALLVATVDQVMGTNGLDHYLTQLQNRAVDTIEGDKVLTALSSEIEGEWTGTSSTLLSKIKFDEPDGYERKFWPSTAGKLSQYLTRRAPAMRAAGWVVVEGWDSHRKVHRWTIKPPSGNLHAQGDDHTQGEN